MEISFACVGDKEGANGSVGVVGAEVSGFTVEARNNAIRCDGLKNRAPGGCVAQRLRALEIFLARNVSELAAVLGVMLIEQTAGAESGTRSQQQERCQQECD